MTGAGPRGEGCHEVHVSDVSICHYRSVTQHAAGDSVAPLARPAAPIVVDDLLS